MQPNVSTTNRPIVRRAQELPGDPRLRDAVRKAEAEGATWELFVASPPPTLGLPREIKVETLVIGDTAGQRHGLRIRWGKWDAREQTVRFEDGAVFDAAGRQLSRPTAKRRRR